MALGLLVLGQQLDRRLGHGLLELSILVGAGLGIYWGYLRWVLGLRFREVMPRRSPATEPAEPIARAE
jgi:hypothetical protein